MTSTPPVISTVVHGRLDLVVPPDWPDGTQVEIRPMVPAADDEPMTSDEIAQLLSAMDELPALDLSAAELAEWDTQRAARKAVEKTQFAENLKQLREMWD